LFNVPNQLTALRLVLAIVLFGFIAFQSFIWSMVLFLIAAGTDWLDGYWARKYGQVTVVGRIFDPFVDKVIICGAFIGLVAEPESGVKAWMATVVVGRELLVTALRSFLEQRGSDFSASMSGKWKMVFQCTAVALSLFLLGKTEIGPARDSLVWLRDGTIWLAVILTVYSGVGYVLTAAKLIRQPQTEP